MMDEPEYEIEAKKFSITSSMVENFEPFLASHAGNNSFEKKSWFHAVSGKIQSLLKKQEENQQQNEQLNRPTNLQLTLQVMAVIISLVSVFPLSFGYCMMSYHFLQFLGFTLNWNNPLTYAGVSLGYVGSFAAAAWTIGFGIKYFAIFVRENKWLNHDKASLKEQKELIEKSIFLHEEELNALFTVETKAQLLHYFKTYFPGLDGLNENRGYMFYQQYHALKSALEQNPVNYQTVLDSIEQLDAYIESKDSVPTTHDNTHTILIDKIRALI